MLGSNVSTMFTSSTPSYQGGTSVSYTHLDVYKSQIWDDTNCVKIVRRYQMMYTVADTFTDSKGRASKRMEVRIRKKVEDGWMLQSTMYVTNTGQELEISHSGQTFIKDVYKRQ